MGCLEMYRRLDDVNDDSDIIGPLCISDWGYQVFYGVPDSQLPYIEASRAPVSWFKSADSRGEGAYPVGDSDLSFRFKD